MNSFVLLPSTESGYTYSVKDFPAREHKVFVPLIQEAAFRWSSALDIDIRLVANDADFSFRFAPVVPEPSKPLKVGEWDIRNREIRIDSLVSWRLSPYDFWKFWQEIPTLAFIMHELGHVFLGDYISNNSDSVMALPFSPQSDIANQDIRLAKQNLNLA